MHVFLAPGSLFFVQTQERTKPTALGSYRDLGHSQIGVFFMCELIGRELLDHLIVFLTNRESNEDLTWEVEVLNKELLSPCRSRQGPAPAAGAEMVVGACRA